VQWIAARHTRRDLDASQRAAAAIALLPLLEMEARDRQRATQNNDAGRAVRAILPEQGHGKAREYAAGLTGASDWYVRDAKRIVAKDASMLERMRDGEITIHRLLKLGMVSSCSVFVTIF
jgi:hypothetical protein